MRLRAAFGLAIQIQSRGVNSDSMRVTKPFSRHSLFISLKNSFGLPNYKEGSQSHQIANILRN